MSHVYKMQHEVCSNIAQTSIIIIIIIIHQVYLKKIEEEHAGQL